MKIKHTSIITSLLVGALITGCTAGCTLTTDTSHLSDGDGSTDAGSTDAVVVDAPAPAGAFHVTLVDPATIIIWQDGTHGCDVCKKLPTGAWTCEHQQ